MHFIPRICVHEWERRGGKFKRKTVENHEREQVNAN